MNYIYILVFAWVFCSSVYSEPILIRREQFPDGFLFGTSSSSYQYEGSILEDGKSLSNWDVFSHVPGMIEGGANGDVATDHYHRYMEDIELMHSLGVSAYRFSISWARILPKGRFGDVNPSGIMFYSKIIDELLARGIQPFVTIHHLDFPNELEERYGSWLDPQMQDEFLHLADVCFRSYGDRVKHWITINEPNYVSLLEFFYGMHPPRHISEIEPFVAAHNMILGHAKAANHYRNHYKAVQGGKIGIAIYAQMLWPLRIINDDIKATERSLAFTIAWCLDPLIFGNYPLEMKILGGQLPRFSATEKRLITNSLDFIGVNHYNTHYIKDCIHSPCEQGGSSVEGFTWKTDLRDGVPIGVPTGIPSSYVVPEGMEGVINYIRNRYNNFPMYVTENGFAEQDQLGSTDSGYLNDTGRVSYHSSYLWYLHKAMMNGADVHGYFVWSLLDNFEWQYGYTIRYGLYHVDFDTLMRSPKPSAQWYREFLSGKKDNASLLLGNSSILKNVYTGIVDEV